MYGMESASNASTKELKSIYPFFFLSNSVNSVCAENSVDLRRFSLALSSSKSIVSCSTKNFMKYSYPASTSLNSLDILFKNVQDYIVFLDLSNVQTACERYGFNGALEVVALFGLLRTSNSLGEGYFLTLLRCSSYSKIFGVLAD